MKQNLLTLLSFSSSYSPPSIFPTHQPINSSPSLQSFIPNGSLGLAYVLSPPLHIKPLTPRQGLFEADQDLDISCELPRTLGIETDWEHTMSQTVHQTDMLAPTEMREFYKTAEYAQELENEIVPYVRQKLDTNDLGHAIFAASVARESEPTERADGKYRTIIVGALMMRVGARIKPEQLQHLRDLVPQIHCDDRFTLPLFDEGFRGPGRVQFLAALDHYQAGVPRSFQEPSCFHCGQIKSDIGHALRMCGRCKRVWYCDRVRGCRPFDGDCGLMVVGLSERPLEAP